MPDADHRIPGSGAWDEYTRRIVEARLDAATEFTVFAPAQARTLKALTSRLLPQDDRPTNERVPVAARIDALLAAGEVDGYRRGDQPWPEDWWQVGLAALDSTAATRSGAPFADLPDGEADDIIAAAAAGAVPDELWQQLPAPVFIAGAVDQVVSVYYADPRAWVEIGWAGPANPRGYLRTGYGRRDPWEPPQPNTGPVRMDAAALTAGGRDLGDRARG